LSHDFIKGKKELRSFPKTKIISINKASEF